MVLLSKMSYKYNYNIIIPISNVNENMNRSYVNDAITTQKFYFRTNFLLKDYKNKTMISAKDLEGLDQSYFDKNADSENIKEMTINEILNGCDKFYFKGILPILFEYIDLYEDPLVNRYYKNHLEFLNLRAKGILWTDAKYLRHFVLTHPKYKNDSLLNNVKYI